MLEFMFRVVELHQFPFRSSSLNPQEFDDDVEKHFPLDIPKEMRPVLLLYCH